MENNFRIRGRIREMSIDEGQLNFMVDNDRGFTAQINLFIDKDCRNKTDAFNALRLYEEFLTKVKSDEPIVVAFAYDRGYNAGESWLHQKHYCDDIHHVVQYRFSGSVKNVTTEVTIAGQSSNIKDKIDGFCGSLLIKNLTLYNDSNGDVVLNLEE